MIGLPLLLVLGVPGRNLSKNAPTLKATVLVFVLKDCPIADQYLPKIGEMNGTFAKDKIQFKVVFEDASLTNQAAKKHLSDYNCDVPFLLDSDHKIARKWKATISPEVYLIAPKSKLVYHGRIDDRYLKLGSPRPQATQHDLADAIQAVLHHKKVIKPYSEPIGCILEY